MMMVMIIIIIIYYITTYSLGDHVIMGRRINFYFDLYNDLVHINPCWDFFKVTKTMTVQIERVCMACNGSG